MKKALVSGKKNSGAWNSAAKNTYYQRISHTLSALKSTLIALFGIIFLKNRRFFYFFLWNY
jgi:hypothetical protein